MLFRRAVEKSRIDAIAVVAVDIKAIINIKIDFFSGNSLSQPCEIFVPRPHQNMIDNDRGQ